MKNQKKPKKNYNQTGTKGARGKQKTAQERAERREIILQRIELLGLWNINKLSLARELGVDWKVINDDIEFLLDNINIVDADEVKFELARSYKRIFNRATRGMQDPNSKQVERASWARVLLETNRQLTNFLESYGLKEVREDPARQQLEEELSARSLREIYEEVYNEKE